MSTLSRSTNKVIAGVCGGIAKTIWLGPHHCPIIICDYIRLKCSLSWHYCLYRFMDYNAQRRNRS